MNLSPAVKLAWQLAAQEALAARKEEIGPVQMFCAITKLADLLNSPDIVLKVMTHSEVDLARTEVAAALTPLSDQRIELTAFRRALRARVGLGQREPDSQAALSRSSILKTLFDRAQILSGGHETAVVSVRHLLAAMLDDRNLLVTSVLHEHRVNVEAVLQRLRNLFNPNELCREEDHLPGHVASSPTPFLDKFGRDLTALARAGALGPIVGRRTEVLQLMHTLLRRSKSNPVLVGEPGVGKTAVAELLAIRLATRECVKPLENCRVVELSLSSLLAGASHAGEREQRLQGVLRECRNNSGIILFVDELHTLVKAGGVGGAVDPADIFKPVLARGELRLIGATTHDEYARYIESDPALERRFGKVIVAEPSSEEALEILKGLRIALENHHGVLLSDEVLGAAVNLSVEFDATHHLPDKAIDLLELAAARTRLPQLSIIDNPDEEATQPVSVSREMIAIVLAQKLGVPTELITRNVRSTSLSDLEPYLKKRVIGQEEATQRVADRLNLSDARLRERRGPLAVFLFLGPTGVGKTAMAKALAHFLFGDERRIVRIDFSEYMEEHSVAKLIGAPPGYVGHEEQGRLTGALRAHPHSVVLLDEVDKGHPKVFDLFLQLFDEGRLTDSKGRTADARHSIFVMTGNLPPAGAAIGFTRDAKASAVESHLKSQFRPEFLNRIDEVIVFQSLSPEHVNALVAQSIEEIVRSVKDTEGVDLQVNPEVLPMLAGAGYSLEYGVRHLQRVIETQFEMPLVEVLKKKGAKSEQVLVECAEGKITVRWN